MKLRVIQLLRGFSEGGRLDWLHPSHGPFPDYAAIYEDQASGDRFEVLLWEVTPSWIALVQGPDRYHNGYPMSYRWWFKNGWIWCRPNKSCVYEIRAPQNDTLPFIASSSIHTHVMCEPAQKIHAA